LKFAVLSRPQAQAIARSLYAVASAGGSVAPAVFEVACIEAAQRHLLRLRTPRTDTSGPLPADPGVVLDRPALHRSTVRLLATLSIADRQVSPTKVSVVGCAEPDLIRASLTDPARSAGPASRDPRLLRAG